MYEIKFLEFEFKAFSEFNLRSKWYTGDRLFVIQLVIEKKVKQVFRGEKYSLLNAFIRELVIKDSLSEIKGKKN